jgi:hypothetical protein
MIPSIRDVALAVAAIPFIYYLIALFSSWQFFVAPRIETSRQSCFHSAGEQSETGSRARSRRL